LRGRRSTEHDAHFCYASPRSVVARHGRTLDETTCGDEPDAEYAEAVALPAYAFHSGELSVGS
jgi:hypothetical protein